MEIINDMIITLEDRILREYNANGKLVKKIFLQGPIFKYDIYMIERGENENFYLLHARDKTYKYLNGEFFEAISPRNNRTPSFDFGPYDVSKGEVRMEGQVLATFNPILATWPKDGCLVVVGDKKIGMFLWDGRFNVREFDQNVWCYGLFSDNRVLISLDNDDWKVITFIGDGH